MTPPRILCVGAATFDTVFKVPAIPSTPTKVLPTSCIQLAGGMAASGGAAIVRLGGLKCTRFGGRAGAPTRREVEALLRSGSI